MATKRSQRGFSALSKSKQRAIAREGGKATHQSARKSSGGRSKS